MSSSQYPGWAYMLAGLVMGLFIAFIVYLQNLPNPDKDQPQADNGNKTVKPKASEPKFDFYKILPELEVVIPDNIVQNNNADTSNPTPPPPQVTTQEPIKLDSESNYILQVGSFKSHAEADKLKATLALLGVEASIQKVTVDTTAWHRVRIGPFKDRSSLNSTRRQLQQNNIKAITLKVKS